LFPFGTQTIHVVLYTLIGVQFYTILESNNKKLIFKVLFTIDYIVTFPCLLTKMSKLAAQDNFLTYPIMEDH
jgi:hypothetical protein